MMRPVLGAELFIQRFFGRTSHNQCRHHLKSRSQAYCVSIKEQLPPQRSRSTSMARNFHGSLPQNSHDSVIILKLL